MTAGKLIVIEAPDGSGKKTQSELLVERLKKAAHPVKKVEFPNYKSPASALVKMYLQGDFGENPEAVNPYAASAFMLWIVLLPFTRVAGILFKGLPDCS